MTAVYPKWSKYKAIICLVIIGIGIPLLFIPWDNTYHSRSLKLIWNLGHIPLFAALATLLMHYSAWLRSRIYEIQTGIIIILALLAGVAVEYIQFYSGRQFSVQDLYLDIIGACLVPALNMSCSEVLFKYSKPLLRLVVVIYLCLVSVPVINSLMDESLARRQFPVLANFESKPELGRFEYSPRLQLQNNSMEVTFGTEKYSGFSLKYFPSDWTGYRFVNIGIQNPGDGNIYLTCRIHDQWHDQAYADRYNRSFTVKPGFNTIEINLAEVKASPRGRQLDMERIGGLGCFTVSLPVPVKLVIRKIELR